MEVLVRRLTKSGTTIFLHLLSELYKKAHCEKINFSDLGGVTLPDAMKQDTMKIYKEILKKTTPYNQDIALAAVLESIDEALDEIGDDETFLPPSENPSPKPASFTSADKLQADIELENPFQFIEENQNGFDSDEKSVAALVSQSFTTDSGACVHETEYLLQKRVFEQMSRPVISDVNGKMEPFDANLETNAFDTCLSLITGKDFSKQDQKDVLKESYFHDVEFLLVDNESSSNRRPLIEEHLTGREHVHHIEILLHELENVANGGEE